MATARKLIYDGLREGNIVPANALLTATDTQNAELLPLLNNYLFELVGEVIGEEPKDWSVPPLPSSDDTPYWNRDPRELSVEQQPASGLNPLSGSNATYRFPPSNSRLIIRALGSAETVYLPPAPDDGALMQIVDLNSSAAVTLDANGRFINDAATLLMEPVSGFNGFTYMYRADRGGWYRLQEMSIDDSSPLPTVFDDVLSIGLYFRAASRFGSTPSSATVQSFMRKLAKLKKRYRQKQPMRAPAAGPSDSIQEYTGVFLPRS